MTTTGPTSTRPEEVAPRGIDVFAHSRNTALLFPLLVLAIFAHGVNIMGFAVRYAESVGQSVIPGTQVAYGNIGWLLGLLAFGTELVARKWRNRGRRALDRTRHPLAAERIEQLVSEIGLKRRPRIALAPRLGDQAFAGGLVGFPLWRPYLAIGPALLALGDRQDRTASEVFSAIVSHELAHLRNRDVFLLNTVVGLRLDNAVKAAFLGFVLLLDQGRHTATGLFYGITAVAVFTLVIEVVCRELLRARESYADQRAARYRPTELRLTLERAERAPTGTGRGRSTSLATWWDWHPSPRTRMGHLVEPSSLLRFPSLYLVIGGLLAGASWVMTAAALSNLFAFDPVSNQTLFVAAALVGAPLGTFTAVGLWREVRHSHRALGRSATLLLKNTLVLAVAVHLGSHLTPLDPYGETHDELVVPVAPVLPWPPALHILCCLTLVGWPHVAATLWRLVRPAPRKTGVLSRCLLVITSALVGFSLFVLIPWAAGYGKVFMP
ncbi:M48 family metalloprotease [Streptomyces sp. NPDC021056]|uniref:M48 family metalloprotease n=1 Tax=Streptomyces sp. NPDC021056 TaxID=3155012 RepID=UPI0033CE1009